MMSYAAMGAVAFLAPFTGEESKAVIEFPVIPCCEGNYRTRTERILAIGAFIF